MDYRDEMSGVKSWSYKGPWRSPWGFNLRSMIGEGSFSQLLYGDQPESACSTLSGRPKRMEQFSAGGNASFGTLVYLLVIPPLPALACLKPQLLPCVSPAVLDNSQVPSNFPPLGLNVPWFFNHFLYVMSSRLSRILHSHYFHLRRVWFQSALEKLAVHTLNNCPQSLDVHMCSFFQPFSLLLSIFARPK